MITGQGSVFKDDGELLAGDAERYDVAGSTWGAGFQPRDRVETVRNCAALPRDFVDRIVLQVANALLGMTAGESCKDWNKGGKQQQQQALQKTKTKKRGQIKDKQFLWVQASIKGSNPT